MRHFLISALFLTLIAGCSTVNVGPHRIDVQQGNALDQDNVARLKPGLSRSQVRFLLGTPLLVDPFRTDRWDYVYLFYKAGELTEQRRITLFFDGDTLVRIEGDLPGSGAAPQMPALKSQPVASKATRIEPLLQPSSPSTSIVAPMPSPKNAPEYVDPRPQAELSLRTETHLEPIRTDSRTSSSGSQP